MTWWQPIRLLVALTTLLASVPAALHTAATVTGTLTMLERPGASRQDLATAVIYLEALDSPMQMDGDAPPSETTIAMRGREFVPHLVVIRRGGTVKFPNQDPFSHNVFSNAAPVNFDLGLYRRGSTRAAAFDAMGVYPIYCNIHARMVSWVISVPSRHVTRANAEGRFVFADVPVGTYRLHVWHERAPHAMQELVVTATGATVRLTLDARGYVSGAHLNKFGVPYSSTRGDRY